MSICAFNWLISMGNKDTQDFLLFNLKTISVDAKNDSLSPGSNLISIKPIEIS